MPDIALTGATGFLGTALARSLESDGWTVHRIVRHGASRPTDIPWDPARGEIDARRLEGMDAIVHLAGESLAQRWTADVRRRIRESRVGSTRLLARAVEQLERKPSVVLGGSAIGIYGDRGDEWLDETSAPGNDFLARVTVQWERAAEPVREQGVRLTRLRTGMVLGGAGGALARFLPIFRAGIGGRLGSGRQWTSWIAIADWVGAVRHILATPTVEGPVNLVSPNPVTNEEFTRTLGVVLHRPTIFPVPTLALRLLYGEMAEAVLLASQRVRPTALERSGYRFRVPELEGALENGGSRPSALGPRPERR